MSVLLFGVSHRSAPVSVLEQLSTDESDQAKIVDQVLQSSLVTEAMVLSTCNRVEVYAVVEAFHGGLSVIGQVLSEHSGMGLNDLTKYAYVRYAEAAVEHLFAVASGPGLRGHRRTAGARPGPPRLRRRRGQPHRRTHPARAFAARAVGRQARALRDRHRRRGRLGGVGRAGHGRIQARFAGGPHRGRHRRGLDGFVGHQATGTRRRRSHPRREPHAAPREAARGESP